MVTVICCIYNSVGVVRRCLEALAEMSTPASVEVVLVDNHAPDPLTREYIKAFQRLHSGWVRIVDPGRNIGCHDGWNFGYKAAAENEYVVKLDDDTVIETCRWAEKMQFALHVAPEIGYVAADIDIKSPHRCERQKYGDVLFDVAVEGIVGFSCVMFRRADVERWGPMKVGTYRTAGNGPILQEGVQSLYGGEEVYYMHHARRDGTRIAYLRDVHVHHLGNEERHPDYAMWKRSYAYRGIHRMEMLEWLASGQHVEHYAQEMKIELERTPPNHVLLIEWSQRLAQIGRAEHVWLLRRAAERGAATGNAVCAEKCNAAAASLETLLASGL